MTEERIHRAVSADGTEIVGRVVGQGPALVLVHGGIGDGEFAWDALLPHLTDRFTCYLPSTRGRGLSADNPDHSPPRLQEDINAFVDSIGEPVCLVGWSGSGPWVLGAAAQTDSVAAAAAWEPALGPTALGPAGQQDMGRFFAAMEQVGLAAADGRLVDAVRAFAPGICTDEEIAALEGMDFYERWADGVPALLRLLQQLMAYEGPTPYDPEALAQINVPVLLLRGQETLLGAGFGEAARHIARYVADPQVHELQGVGHFAPVLAPEHIAEELVSFFEKALQPTGPTA